MVGVNTIIKSSTIAAILSFELILVLNTLGVIKPPGLEKSCSDGIEELYANLFFKPSEFQYCIILLMDHYQT